MDNVFVLYTCYTDAENEPCIYVSVYSDIEKAKAALEVVKNNTKREIDVIIRDAEKE